MAREQARNSRKADQPDFPSIKIITPPIRLSYPKIFDPEKNDQGKDVWETDALVEPNREGDEFLKKLEDALFQVMEDYFGPEDEWPRGRTDGHPQDKIRKLDPDKLPGSGVTADWSKFTARSYSPVGIVDADRNEVLSKREAYGGRWARLSLTITVYDNKSKGPAIYLNNVQLLDNDESFGGRPSAESDFDRWDGRELAPRGERSRDRDDREGSRDDRGRGDGVRPSRDGSRDDRARSRSDRDARDSDRQDTRDRRDSRGDDARPTRGRGGDADRDRDNGVSSRHDGRNRDRGEERDSRDGRRGSREEDARGGSRRPAEDRGDSRDRSRSRDDADDRRDAGRGRSRDDADDRHDDRDDPRPSGRGSRDEDWN